MSEKSLGEKLWDNAVELEKRLWDRDEYYEEDIVLFSDIMDYLTENFIKWANNR